SSGTVMRVIVAAAYTLEARYWFALYMDAENWRHAVAFVLAAAGGCLTKPNGLAVLLVPAIVAMLARRFELLRRPSLYAAAAIVLILAAPFVLISYRLDAGIGDFGWVTRGEISAR